MLQNAKDSVGKNEFVSIHVSLIGKTLTFKHSGNPFKEEDVLHLIFHGSSKKTEQDKTGRFGTGFMSTHLLSRKVRISGQLTDGRFFQFDLNREAETVAKQKENLDSSFDDFDKSIRNDPYQEYPYLTVFSYELDNGLSVAENGLNELGNILPFVMAFNKKISSIEVVNNSHSYSVLRDSKLGLGEESPFVSHIIRIGDERCTVVTISLEKKYTAAILLSGSDDNHEIVELGDKYPRLYFDFPLFGTEKLGIPLVINSDQFDVRDERDGVFLSDEVIDTIENNKQIFKFALFELKRFIESSIQKRHRNIQSLFSVDDPFEYDWLDRNWIVEVLQELSDSLQVCSALIIENKTFQLNQLAIPYIKNQQKSGQFYELVKATYPDNTPEESEVSKWLKVARGFSKISGSEIEENDFIVDYHKICGLIQSKSNIQGLSLFLTDSSTSPNSILWLNKLFSIFSKDDAEYYTAKYRLIPNQNGNFIIKELDNIFEDNIEDKSIKSEVIQYYDWGINDMLIDSELKFPDGLFPKYNLEKVVKELIDRNEQFKDSELENLNIRTSLIAFFSWNVRKKREANIKNAFVIVEEKGEQTETKFLKRRFFTNNAEKLLAPQSFWDNFSLYYGLVKRRFVLISEYTKFLAVEDCAYLCELGLLYIKPLIVKSKLSKADIKLLLKNSDDIGLFSSTDEDFELSEVSEIVYLTTTDDNILAKSGDSFKSARGLLSFLLEQVLQVDNLFNEDGVLILAETNVYYRKCIWLSRLKETKWIPFKSLETEKIVSEKPSAANITSLIKDDPLLLGKIRSRNAALFFNHLGISVADIIRNTLEDYDEKLSWDMAFSSLLSNGKINPDLAVEMLEDSNLQSVYLDKKKQREQIKANQQIGYLFEAIFRKIFESDEYKTQGFTIERTAIGSDFGIVYEEDIIDDNGEQVKFKIGELLIELKATGKPYAEITTTQAEEASGNQKNYILAVLPLSNFEVDQENVHLHTKFVTNIAEPIQIVFQEYQKYSTTKSNAQIEKKGVKLSIEDGTTRYRISQSIWEHESALHFDDFVNWIKSKVIGKIEEI